MAATTVTGPWRAALTFAATTGLIGMWFGVLARTSGLSLVMTCGISVLVFAGGSQFLALATIASGGTPLVAVLGGIVLDARHLPYGLAVAPLLRGPLWKRALSSHIVLDESTALALAQPTPELARLAF
jgi:predicted branched-subunit amino acid permease